MAGKCRRSLRLLAGAIRRANLGLAASGEDSAGTLASRDGLPGAQGRVGVGPLRGAALVGLESSCNAGEHGVCFSPHGASPGKKKTLGAKFWTLPQTRARLQVRLIH